MANQQSPVNKNLSKIVSSYYPRLSKQHFIETSIEKTYIDTYLPINNYENDNFIEFRIPATTAIFTDLSQMLLNFQIQIRKKIKEGSTWSAMKDLVSGDHIDIINGSSFSIFKHLSIRMNNVQIVNDVSYSYASYLKLLTKFSTDDLSKIGKLYHLELYEDIINNLSDDTYFQGLTPSNPIYKRLTNLRNHGVFCRTPLLADICETDMFLLDGIDINIKLDLHPDAFILNTAQQKPDLNATTPKKYFLKLNDVKLDVTRVKPTENSYTALMKSLMPNNNNTPYINYLYTSKLLKQYHLTSGINEYIVETPYHQSLPEKLYFCFLKYDSFNTTSYDQNGLFLEHLNLKKVFITINGSTVYNVDCNFSNHDVSMIYDITLKALDKHNMLTFDSFIKGATFFTFPLTNFDNIANIRAPYYGSLRITLSFHSRLADSGVLLMFGDILSSLSVNYKREILLNRN